MMFWGFSPNLLLQSIHPLISTLISNSMAQLSSDCLGRSLRLLERWLTDEAIASQARHDKILRSILKMLVDRCQTTLAWNRGGDANHE